MKKTLLNTGMLLLLSVIILPFKSYSSLVIRIGHPTGTYKTVTENPSGTELTCSGDGSAVCKWSNGDIPCNIIYVNGNPITDAQAGNIVQQNIDNGILEGKVFGDNGIGSYSWYIDANGDVNYTFDDGLTN